MRLFTFLTTIMCFVLLPFVGISQQPADTSETIPQGWELRFDEPSSTMEEITFSNKENALHIKSGPAAIYYKPEMMASGTYSLSGTFTQLEKGKYPEAYGLFTGGKNLQEENQQYLYFLVRQDGKYLIKRRTGAETETIVDWTESEAVQPMDDDTGPTENRLEIKKEESGIAFLINGQEVERMGLSELSYLEGMVGLRVNHNLNVEVEQFELSGGME